MVVSTLAQENTDFQEEFQRLMGSPAFESILRSVQVHAKTQGIPIRQATEQIVKTFRAMDQLWRAYIYREGVDRIGGG